MNPDPRDPSIRYTSPRGRVVELGPASVYRYGDTDLFDAAVSYDGAGPSDFRREPREAFLTAYVEARSEKEGMEARQALEDALDDGAASGEYGVIEHAGWSTRCLCVRRRKDSWWFDGRFLAAELTLLLPDGTWTKGATFSFRPGSAPEAEGWLDFPFDFGFDFSPNAPSRTLRVDAPSPCQWRIVVYGPAKDPYVLIGGNRHQVFATVPAGGIMVADSRDWSIVVRDADGGEVDAFDARIRGAEGSGEFMWQPIEPGASSVSWSETFGWDITAYREAG